MITTSSIGRPRGNSRPSHLIAAAVLATALAATAPASAAPAAPASAPAATAAAQAAPAATPFATVDDVVITQADYDMAFAQAARSKFYHGKPPENAVAALQREVGQSLVDEVLLVKEALRRGLQPDHADIQKTLAGYDEKYRGSEQWAANRARLLPGLNAKLERESLIGRLQRQVKDVGEPAEADLQQYWEQHQDKFTTPEQVRLSVILLKVDPSSPQAKWDGAIAEGAAIVKRLRGGARFEELAQLHSNDQSAAQGGDMGLVHVAMLPEPAQEALKKLRPGEVGDAVVLLEGVAVFRLDERRESRLNALDTVRARAGDLWARDKGQQAWLQLLEKLRRDTPVKMDESRFLPLATAAAPGAVAPR